MPLTRLTNADNGFPPIESALGDGLLAIGGDLSVSRLVNAYRQGIFPWFSENQPILWWSPDPRMVLFTEQIKISRSLKKTLRTTDITVTIDHAFADVMKACAALRQSAQDSAENDTWIHRDMLEAYIRLHQQNIAHSVECWQQEQLVGGLYGVAVGQVFFGESMFSKMKDSSKIALVTLCQQLHRWQVPIIDCQIYSNHLASMGATEIARRDFVAFINPNPAIDKFQQWQLDADLPLPSRKNKDKC